MKTESTPLYPLNEFYTLAGLPIPPFEIINPEKIPQPQRKLLAHQNDMTPTIEQFYRHKVHINLKQIIRREHYILREVVLAGDDERPLVFGAIRINLGFFVPKAQKLILECYQPLGGVLRTFDVPHSSNPKAYFKVMSDQIINRALNLHGQQILYGRINRLLTPSKQTLVKVVEILPP